MLQGSILGTPTKTDNKLAFMNKDNSKYKYYSKNFDSDNIDNEGNSNIMDQYICCGGGVVHDNILYSQHHVGTGYEYYPQDHIQSTYDNYDNHEVYFNNGAIQVYNDFGKHSHTALMYDNNAYYGVALNCQHKFHDNLHDVVQCPMSITDHGYQLNGLWAQVVCIHGDLEDKARGYYLYAQSINGSPHTLTPYRLPIIGALQIVRTIKLHMVPVCEHNGDIQITENNNDQLAFGNCVKDLKTHEHHGCSYEDYITNIIDAIIDSSDVATDNDCMSRFDMNANTWYNIPELDTDTIVHSPIRGPHRSGITGQRVDNARTLIIRIRKWAS